MSILLELHDRFRRALAGLVDDPQAVADALAAIRPSQDPRFGDYQANFAMPLSKRLGRPARDIALEVAGRLEIADFCQEPEVAGPGFINLRLRDAWLAQRLAAARTDPRLGIPETAEPRTYVIDYSAPNVAKPMHVGHIRSTVIGASLYRTLRFLGHRVISDNHIGEWGTQFGMILYGYKHFRDEAAYRAEPVQELARLYRLVRQVVDYFEAREKLAAEASASPGRVGRLEAEIAALRTKASGGEGKKADKQAAKELRRAENALKEVREELASLEKKVDAVDASPLVAPLAAAHPRIAQAVLAETAKLHAGDEENLRLWREFLPPCLVDIERIYRRLGVTFDHTLGESAYHALLPAVVAELRQRGLARQSEGAVCVFLDEEQPPMIVQKQDGAFLYATTDLATLRYRRDTWRPDAILYVVDHRQSHHFQQLFAVARKLGHERVELTHVSFGTVLGEDGRPFKTRAGDTVGLEGLLDEAVRRAAEIVRANNPDLAGDRQREIAETVGIAALKYADLSQNRTSDYTFSYEKMLAMNGNTATYMQYAYARVCSIFAKGSVDVESLRAAEVPVLLTTPAERALGLELLRFGEAIEMAVADYRPNQLTGYLFELANCYSSFFEACPVLRADTEPLRQSRLALCDLTARTIRQGLFLLGIDVVEKM
jgi:arginyl-tRNA synthetase